MHGAQPWNRHDYRPSGLAPRRPRAEPECRLCGQVKSHPDHR